MVLKMELARVEEELRLVYSKARETS